MDRDCSSCAVIFDEQTNKDLSPVGFTLHKQDAMSELRRFEFGKLPAEMRLRIYKLLLVDYDCIRKFDRLHGSTVSGKRINAGSGNSSDDQAKTLSDDSSVEDDDEDNYDDDTDQNNEEEENDDDDTDQNDDEDDDDDDDDDDSQDKSTYPWLRFHSQPLFPQQLYRRFSLYPGILRSNKLIHNEASAVLYGKNPFSWCASALIRMPVWHLANNSQVSLPQHYSCLITRMHLFVDLRITRKVMSITPYWFQIMEHNLVEFGFSFAPNNLKVLKVDIRHPRFWLERTVTGAVLEKRKGAL